MGYAIRAELLIFGLQFSIWPITRRGLRTLTFVGEMAKKTTCY
jgi:hypothetical protein